MESSVAWRRAEFCVYSGEHCVSWQQVEFSKDAPQFPHVHGIKVTAIFTVIEVFEE